ncbi:MAG: TetR/AcrR family transcriptional regulator [Burkholderiaceae bacterium]
MTRLEKIGKLQLKARKQSAKRGQRRDELASAAIDALKQLGYARTSLRDIAENSGVSVGILHYYFDDKTDLIKYCVRKYKADFVSGLDAVLEGHPESASIAEAFAQGLSDTIRRGAQTHRLWYDIRAQALFDAGFSDVVDEIEAELVALVSRLLRRLDVPQDQALAGYMSLDGAFRYYLHRHLAGDDTACDLFKIHVLNQLAAMAVLAEAKSVPRQS